jgi:ABC-type phosphate transport system ATPase subunit
MLRKMTINVMTGMTKATVSNIVGGGGSGESTGCRTLERIKLPRTIAPKKLTPGKKVLHRKNQKGQNQQNNYYP